VEGNLPDIKDPGQEKEVEQLENQSLLARIKAVLGEQVVDVRATERLTRSPARLVNAEGGLTPELQRVYELLHKEHEETGKVLEINLNHPLLNGMTQLDEKDPRFDLLVNQLYENTLLLEGLHPDPAAMVEHIQQLMLKTLE
jgi:molecular chaperone HtpG